MSTKSDEEIKKEMFEELALERAKYIPQGY